MKFVYYSCKLLSAPFYAASSVFFALSYVTSWIGDVVHDQTELRAWLVLHESTLADRGRKAQP